MKNGFEINFDYLRQRIVIIYFFPLIIFGFPCSGQDVQKPNVLFMISDDLTTTALSSYENSVSKTPHIDKLASEGTRYTMAYCQVPFCGPSRASMMFGYYPSATQTYAYVSGRENVGNDRKSWSQLFKENGYYTARISKIFHMGYPFTLKKGQMGPTMRLLGRNGLTALDPNGKLKERPNWCKITPLVQNQGKGVMS